MSQPSATTLQLMSDRLGFRHVELGVTEALHTVYAIAIAAHKAEQAPMDADSWAELHRLREAVKGPDGYATWKDAAVAERVKRVKAEQAAQTDPPPYPAKSKDEDLTTSDQVFNFTPAAQTQAQGLTDERIEDLAAEHADFGRYEGQYVWWKFHNRGALCAFARAILAARPQAAEPLTTREAMARMRKWVDASEVPPPLPTDEAQAAEPGDERARFEAWITSNNGDITRSRFNEDDYEDDNTLIAWDGWCAALAPALPEAPL